MIALWFGAAGAQPRTVDSAADTNTGTGPSSGTLRYQLNQAAAGDTITFAASAFPAGSVTTVTVGSALPTLNDVGVVLDGDGRVAIACAAAMVTGNGLTVTANDVEVRGLEVRDCPGDGVRVSGHDVSVVGNHLHHNDQSGALVTGLSTTTSGAAVRNNDVHDNCVAPGTVSCAGVAVKKGTGTGTGPPDVVIAANEIAAQGSLSPGIALQAGTGHRVSDNLVEINAGAGISVAATTAGVSVDTVEVTGNVVSGNTGAGILLGTRSSFVTVTENEVADNGYATVPSPGISVYGSDDHVVARNTVTGSAAEGILVSGLVNGSPAERATIRKNLVGTDAAGAVGLGNGAGGVRLVGSGAAAVNHLVEQNTLASNAVAGLIVDAGAVTVTENVIGLGPDRVTARGNQGAGISVTANGAGAQIDGRVGGVQRPNLVAANGGPGVVVLAANVLVSDNVIGWALTGAARGNGDEGIWVKAGADALVRRNRVGNSGDEGILVWASSAQFPVTRGVYHYGVIAHRLAASTLGGYGEIFGDDAINTGARNLADAYDVQPDLGMGLVVHEGGHNLGLRHNGSVAPGLLDSADPDELVLIDWMLAHAAGDNKETNHLSAMNYWYGGGQGGLIDPLGNRVYDYARSYEVTGGRALLEDLDQSAGYSEADTLWTHAEPIPDEVLYRVRWKCPPGAGIPEKRRFPHRPGLTTLAAADRRMDLDCDGLRETTVATHALSDGAPLQTTFDEWAALRFAFQRDAEFDTDGPPEGAGADDGAETPTPLWPRAELYGGCANPRVPRSGAAWRTPVVLFGSDLFPAHRVDLVAMRLSGAPPFESFLEDLDADGFEDLWLEFRPADMAGLHTNATELDLYAHPLRLDGSVIAEAALGAAFDMTRVTAPPDADADGIQDACDACPLQGHPPGGHRLPNGCPP